MPEAPAPPKPEPEAELDALVPRPALIGRGHPFPPRTQVVAVQFGTFLSLHSERLQIKKEGKVVDEIPLFRMSELVVGAKGVALSCDLIRELCARGIRTVFLESTGTPYAMLSSPMLTATVRTRREQMAAFEDERGVRIARALVAGKLHNQANLLKYFAKYLAQADPVRFDRVRDAASTIEALLPRLGRPGGPGVDFPGGDTEWDARPAGPVGLRPSSAPRARRVAPDVGPAAVDTPVAADVETGDPMFEPPPPSCGVEAQTDAGTIRVEDAEDEAMDHGADTGPAADRRPHRDLPLKIDAHRGALMGVEGAAGRIYWKGVRELLGEERFAGRRHRGADDPVNASLNYGYGILYSKVWAALMIAGLEPFAGFLHVDRPGKPSLVLDVVEEYRQPVVDRTVIALFTRGTTIGMEDGKLDYAARRAVAGKVLERLETGVTYEGKSLPMRAVIQAQAHHLATALRGERRYRPYRFRW